MTHPPPHHIHRTLHPTVPGVTASLGCMHLERVHSQPLPFSMTGFNPFLSPTPFHLEGTQARLRLGLEASLISRTKAKLGKFCFNPLSTSYAKALDFCLPTDGGVGGRPGPKITLDVPDLNIHLAFLRPLDPLPFPCARGCPDTFPERGPRGMSSLSQAVRGCQCLQHKLRPFSSHDGSPCLRLTCL